MLQNVERLPEFRWLNYEDENARNSTTKRTELVLQKGTYPSMSCANTLAFSTYSTLMMTWKKQSETGLQTSPTRRPCMSTFIIKFMIYYTISSARSADASDMIDQITLVYVLDQ